MKRIKDRWRLLLRTRRAEARRSRRRTVAYRRRELSQRHVLPRHQGMVIVAPTEFIIESHLHHDRVAEFLSQLRAAAKSCHATNRTVVIDFRQTVQMVASATLLFFSELQRLRAIFPSLTFGCIPPKHPVVNEVLQHLQIFEMLGYKSSVVPSRPDVISWRTASSANVDGPQVGSLIETYKSLGSERAKHLFRGVSEAMGNAVNHAYIAPRNDGLPSPPAEKWWMFCRQDEGKLVVAVCDLGIGIPRSLPLLYPEEAFMRLLDFGTRGRVRSDASMIEAAMQIRRTRTAKRGRGKGLGDTRRLVDEVRGGRLVILSNRGELQYRGGAYLRSNYEQSIKGTVVLWVVPLNGGSHGESD
ncbi:conserved hypothetical protein [Xanthomonas citri pv. citri]|uniref:Histidine kinase/HSP90-like ATPase domain-containing protein n=1 Tax=Xanthomonas citri pv. citri TaxID=611301 RepID=A0A0U5F9U9_XANCI|nr:conserved hypothetical protein [Xanthomonas citri pv. citri]CEH58342.1 conserved hypothetical protein [Xanthomonas citri pv. citri]CEH82161.1 conserved hypothetical protein [Xanthomonas citri pv. citri]CEJ21680.1 conserved hypothetical protein [Xanthomonas citri pv. citri]CEJ26270.1 conserved hypothetical protein [Xanthomonas citri pv. citri]